MREILFRGKNIDNGNWVYGLFIPDMTDLSGKNNLCDWGFIKPFGKTREERYMQYVKKITVGQYTGLTDKNGVKIFEGDIIKGKEKESYTVEYNEEIASFVARAEEPVKMLPCMNAGTMRCYEVVGNIYDNPELLNEV